MLHSLLGVGCSRVAVGGLRGGVVAAALALAGAAAGQGVAYRTLLTTAASGPRVPAPYVDFTIAAMVDDDHVMVQSGLDGVFLSDGVTVRRIMIPGTPVPGQPAGVVWSGSIRTDAARLAGGGAVFSAAVSGPGYTGSAVPMFGPVEAPTIIEAPGLGGPPATATGLSWTVLNGQGGVVGPLGGAGTVVIPSGYTVPGRSRSGSLNLSGVYLSGSGLLSVRYDVSGASDCLVAGPGGIRVAGLAGSALDNDRGAITVGSVAQPASQALPDGSVFVQSLVRVNGATRDAMWLSPPSGPARVVAIGGDPAPGLGAGFTFASGSQFTPLGANRAGSLLFQATLAGPGVGAGNATAVYLWRRGHLVLVARSSTERSVAFFGVTQAAGLNENDEVGLIVDGGVILYRPGAGTVTALQRGRPFPGTGPVGTVGNLYPFYGVSSLRRWSGGDDASICPLSQDGRIVACVNVNGAQGGSAVVSIRMDDDRCGPDFNNDGFVDFFDYADFVGCFEGGACPEGRTADFNGDDFADFFDYLDFVQAFETGC